MIEVVLIALVIMGCYAAYQGCRLCKQQARQRNAEANASVDLPAARQTMSERRRQRQNQDPPAAAAPAAAAAAAAAAAQPQPVQPSAPVERTEEMIRNQFFCRTLEDGESIRSLEKILAAANDRYDANTDGNVLARSYRAATSSVRTLTGKPECCICLDDYEAGEVVCWAKTDECDHLFHDECIIEWMKNHDDCPLCRAKLMVVE